MICVLSEDVVKRISAGEVIERPASVVKELVENSIDAKARNIEIEIEQAGKRLIRVTDDGCGIPSDELELAIQRHATSKIMKFDDIYNLDTLGFRGEALPAIMSVSEGFLLSKPQTQQIGWKIEISAGKVLSKRECPCKDGTIVEVRNLFFNTPARAKFLKEDYLEYSHISKVIEGYALCYKDISFKFRQNEKEVMFIPHVKEYKERVYDVLGKDVVEKSVEINRTDSDFKLYGFISQPDFSFQYNRYQYIFVNNRPVTNRLITQAVYDAYRGYIPSGRHPFFIIFIEVPKKFVDVNCHPTKKVVKFADDNFVYEFVLNGVKDTLSSVQVCYEFIPSDNGFKLTPTQPQPIQASLDLRFKKEEPLPSLQISEFQQYVPIGSLFNRYLIYQTSDSMLLIDQHAAAERILYEKLLKFNPNEGIESLLIPFVFSTTHSQACLLRANLDVLASLGFEISEFGHNSFVFKSYPRLLGDLKNVQEFIDTFLNSLETSQKHEAFNKDEIAKSACKAAVCSSEFVSRFEMKLLIEELMRCSEPARCPHGRPTFIEIKLGELDRKFGRL